MGTDSTRQVIDVPRTADPKLARAEGLYVELATRRERDALNVVETLGGKHAESPARLRAIGLARAKLAAAETEARGIFWHIVNDTDEGHDECVTCGGRFNATPRDAHPICPACKRPAWRQVQTLRGAR